MTDACQTVQMAEGPTVRRLQLGRELHRLRQAAGIPQEVAAGRVRRTRTWLSRAEGGKLAPNVAEVELLITYYGVASDSDECQRILEIATEARKRTADRVPEWARIFVGLEAEAVEIRHLAVGLVPGLLQTEAYTRAITQASDPSRDAAEVERFVAIRRERRKRLTSSNPLRLRVVMGEAVIRRLVGFGDEVRLEQLQHLQEIAALPTVSVQVIPYDARPHASMGTSFEILHLPDGPKAQIVYLEDLWSADYKDGDAQVRMYSQVFDTLGEVALDAASTLELLREAAG